MFLNTAGIGKMADVLSMSWIEIASLNGPFTNEKEQASKCNELLHPDHLLVRLGLSIDEKFFTALNLSFHLHPRSVSERFSLAV